MKQTLTTIECPTCGFADNPVHARFCGQCASVLPIVCPTCGAINPMGFRFCGQCATPFTNVSDLGTTRRVVTVLFADVCNYTTLTNRIGAEQMYLLLDPCLRRLAETIQRFEGSIDKFTGDGLMAVFGLPIALEQHAVQATYAALAMFDELAAYNAEIANHTTDVSFQIRIGLASGEVIAGRLGSDRYSDTTVIGEAVNLAARLQQSADPNAIMVNAATAHSINPIFVLQEPVPINLKGFDHDVMGYAVQGKRDDATSIAATTSQTPLIGRDEEFELLNNALQLLEGGMGGIIGMIGPAGIGKTRLAGDVLAQYRQSGVKVYEGECTTATRHVPYSAFLGVVNALCGILPTDTRENIRSKIRAAVSRSSVGALIDLVPYIEYLLSIELVDEALLKQVNHFDAAQLKRQVFLALREMFVAEARQHPVILVLDDLQWADDVSLELLDYLADSLDVVPLLLYLIARDDEAPHLKTLFQETLGKVNQRGQIITLQPLSNDASMQIAQYLLPNASHTILQYIARQADGMPFYIEELARHAVEVKIDLQAIDEQDITATTLPLSLNALMRGRYDRLPTSLARTLAQASIIGRRFSQELLQAVSDADDLAIELEQLQQRGFVTLYNRSSDTWRFQHILTHETVYASMLATQRSQLHGQVGAALEKSAGGRIDEFADQLAYHFSRSNRRDKAIQYTIHAAQRAAERYANDDALRMFDEVERMINGDMDQFIEELALINEQRGTIFNVIGRHEDARKAYQQAIEEAQHHEFWSTTRIANLYRSLATSEEKQGHYDQAMTYLKLARETLGDGSLLEHARIDADAGWIAMLCGDVNEAERLLGTALSVAEINQHESLQAIIANRLAGVYWQRGDLRSAHALVAQSLGMSRRLGDQLAVAKALNNLGIIANDQLDWDMAETYYTQSMETYMELGDIHGHIRTAHNTAVTALMRGKLNNALQSSRTALMLAKQVGDEVHIGLSYFQQGMIALLVQDHHRARRSLIQAECTFRSLRGHLSKRADVAEQLSRLAYSQRRIHIAEYLAQRAIRFAERDGNPIVVFRSRRLQAFLLLQGATPLVGETMFLELEQEAAANPLEKGWMYMAWGEALQVRGRHNEAQTYFERATQLFDLIKVPPLLRKFG